LDLFFIDKPPFYFDPSRFYFHTKAAMWRNYEGLMMISCALKRRSAANSKANGAVTFQTNRKGQMKDSFCSGKLC
jgi:hypothetical protein